MNEDVILRVKDLGVTFGERTVLENIAFSVRRGSTVAFLGPNGSGKSTLLKALMGLIPHRGTVAWSADVRFGYVPQSFVVDNSLPLTVTEFFALKAVRHGAMSHALRDVGILPEHGDVVEILDQPLGTLSSGQLQRVLIAWALASKPNVLLFDEPTSGIDIGGQQNIYNLIDNLKRERGLTVLLISHDLHVVYAHADEVLCVNRTLTCNGVPSDVLDAKALGELYGTHISFYAHRHD